MKSRLHAITSPSLTPGRLLLGLALLLISSFMTTVVSAEEDTAPASLSGRVLGGLEPTSGANVYVFEVESQAVHKATTDRRGHYLFQDLPAGLYRVIAFKGGFVPTVELLIRRSQEMAQVLELRMQEQRSGEIRDAEDYWSVRKQIPRSVLREIDDSTTLVRNHTPEPGTRVSGVPTFSADVAAVGGVESLGEAAGQAQVSGAEIGIRSEVGPVAVGIDGSIKKLDIGTGGEGLPTSARGEARSVALHLSSPYDQQISLQTTSGQLAGATEGTQSPSPVDLEHLRVQYSGRAGNRGHSSLVAQYIEEINYFAPQGLADATAGIPEASRTLEVEGQYQHEVSDSTSLKAGIQYTQRTATSLKDLASPSTAYGDESVGVFGRANSQVGARVLVEYGLYSTVRDGSLSLMPTTGVVIDLNEAWKARLAASHRIQHSEDGIPAPGFTSALHKSEAGCHEAGQACYEVAFTRSAGADHSLSVGAVLREYAETLRVYFSEDFFDHLESLFLVRGDSMPEVQVSMTRRLAPKVLAKLESNLASGGGGIVYATDNQAYENQVRYLVTSLDTRFQQTSTGVFVAFHHLEQELNALEGGGEPATALDMQRLQLMLTQDLDILAALGSGWKVQLNMELSKGATPFALTPDDGIRKKLTGGLSVSF